VPVLAASSWKSNAEMILDCVRLQYLKDSDSVLDPTYGKGIWWKLWTPARLTRHDKFKLDGVDYRSLPHGEGEFDAVAFDPPYVCPGGRESSGIPDFFDQYGMDGEAKTPGEQQAINNLGLAECYRVVKPGGYVLTKCADYVWSGKLVLGTHETLVHALSLGFKVQDRMEHVGHPRPQPQRTRKDGQAVRQHHARRNLSTLFVLQRPSVRVRARVLR
jgi:hypothetical protein